MRVLVACEFSGIVRDAFIERGHDAISVDLLPSERPGPHIIGDAVDAIYRVRPKLLLAFPPCTYLCNSGVRWLYKDGRPDPERWYYMEQAAILFKMLLGASVPMVAVENPVPHGHAKLPKPTQYVQPYDYGEPETKRTGLWLRHLPKLTPTNIVDGRTQRVHHASPGPDRWKERSRTLPGIAAAMADQWGSL